MIGPPDARGGPSHHGAALGRALASMAEAGEAALIEAGFDQLAQPCASCAFRRGSMPNQSAQTVSEALSCLTSDESDFGCHHGLDQEGEPTRHCAGWLRAKAAPWETFKAAIGAALADVKRPAGQRDEIRAAYVEWLIEADPDNRLDDHQRAALWARR